MTYRVADHVTLNLLSRGPKSPGSDLSEEDVAYIGSGIQSFIDAGLVVEVKQEKPKK